MTTELMRACPTCGIDRAHDGPGYRRALAQAGKPMCPDSFHPDLHPDYEQDGFLSEQPDSLGGGWVVQIGSQKLGHVETLEEAVSQARHCSRPVWKVNAAGDLEELAQ